ncbi:MAG TPA: hypothetical protein VD884_08215 [Ohtaekwangia sp.]|nr:hypothetical protein [Ohtaekwangia sp.]
MITIIFELYRPYFEDNHEVGKELTTTASAVTAYGVGIFFVAPPHVRKILAE